jgi:hypothetical protein
VTLTCKILNVHVFFIFYFYFLMMKNLDKAWPLDPPLQSKPWTCVPQPRKFSYTDQGKLLAFYTRECGPKGEFTPSKSQTLDLRGDTL